MLGIPQMEEYALGQCAASIELTSPPAIHPNLDVRMVNVPSGELPLPRAIKPAGL